MTDRRAAATHAGALAAGLALGLALGGGPKDKPATPQPPPTPAVAQEPAADNCYTLDAARPSDLVKAVSDAGVSVVLRFSDPGTATRAPSHGCYVTVKASSLGDTKHPDALFVLREAP